MLDTQVKDCSTCLLTPASSCSSSDDDSSNWAELFCILNNFRSEDIIKIIWLGDVVKV